MLLVEQRIVYSIYYNSTLTLPLVILLGGRGLVRLCWLVAVSEDGGREQEALYYYNDTCKVYILIILRDGHSCIA